MPSSRREPDTSAPLFERGRRPDGDAPLAERMRPRTLDAIVGHDAVLAPDGLVRRALAQDRLPSLVLWGEPGTGKTTLARVLAAETSLSFEPFSAVLGGVKDVRAIVARAKERRGMHGRRTLLFVDEIHRFNRAQQDAFLPHVEDGTLVLVGATTENPSFALNAALLSRARVVRLEPLSPEALVVVLERALADEAHGLGGRDVTAAPEALAALAVAADGDARRALGLLDELAGHALEEPDSDPRRGVIDEARVRGHVSQAALRHDRAGDAHYDVVSAFIKSLRGSDPDAALYWMARLLEGGDDPRFVLRRMLIFASEDIGNADPRALSVAVDGAAAYERIGMPEGRIVLGQVCTYLACAPKSNAAYKAVDAALAVARKSGSLPVPARLRNAPTALAKSLGHGATYRYPHDFPHAHGGWVPDAYLPDALDGRVRFYEPKAAGYEKHLAERLAHWRRDRDAAGQAADRGGAGEAPDG